MTQQFSRPGAFDLSGLASPAAAPASGQQGTTSAYATLVTEGNFQGLVEASMTAPVMIVVFSPTQMPASAQLADDFVTVSAEFEGKFLVGLVNADQTPAIVQAMQVPSVPFVLALMQGRPLPLLQDVIPLADLRATLTQMMQQLAVQGVTARHQPLSVAAAPGAESDEPVIDPRYAAAQDALGEGNIEKAVAEYQKLVDANPADAEAVAGLAMAKLLQRTMDVDLNAARAAAAASPDDVSAQTLVADLDLLGGHVEDAFARLVDLVRRTDGPDRNAAREHLLALFAAVGGDDPRVIKARQHLASALY